MKVRGARFFIVGGAGFVGSHFVRRLLRNEDAAAVTVYDNFSSGLHWYLEDFLDDPRFQVVEADVHELDRLESAMNGYDVVIHLASNPDIARAATEPMIDFDQGTLLTNNVVEAMRRAGVPRILYASGSGVYGDLEEHELSENYGPMLPISTYGASKLAGEALIASYCAMFDFRGVAFRFGNVVGPRQTHGVGFDLLKQLKNSTNELHILGDGSQSKPYIYVDDIITAVLTAFENVDVPFDVFNVAPGDYITVTEIADIVIEVSGRQNVSKVYAGGDRGWRGDVPVVRLNTDKIRKLGWKPTRGAAEAIRDSVTAMWKESDLLFSEKSGS